MKNEQIIHRVSRLLMMEIIPGNDSSVVKRTSLSSDKGAALHTRIVLRAICLVATGSGGLLCRFSRGGGPLGGQDAFE